MKRFIMKCAERAGCPSHNLYARRLTSRELSEKIALANIDPPQETKLEWLLAQLCHLFASANSKKRFKLDQFMFWRRQKPMSEADQKERVRMWAAAFGKQRGK